MERRDLGRLPPDLMAMGWQLVSAREVSRPTAPTRYTVTYARPFELGIDDEPLAHHHKGDWWVRVATTITRSASWEEAYQHAIALMRDADARRWSPGQEP